MQQIVYIEMQTIICLSVFLLFPFSEENLQYLLEKKTKHAYGFRGQPGKNNPVPPGLHAVCARLHQRAQLDVNACTHSQSSAV